MWLGEVMDCVRKMPHLESRIKDVMRHWEIRSKADPNCTTTIFEMGGIVSAGAGKVGWLGGTVYVHHRAPVLRLIVIRPIQAMSSTDGIVSLSRQRTLLDPQTSEY